MSGVVVDLCPHDMTAAWCSICKERDTPAEKKRRSAWAGQVEELSQDRPDGFVKAKYDGRCQGCHNRIEEGDWIAWDAEVDGWVGTCCKGEG